MDLHACLSDPRRYERQIERLHHRQLVTPSLQALRQQGVSLAELYGQRRRASRLLARTIRRGEYEFAPGQVREIEVNGKVRVVYAYRLTDLVVHGVVADILLEAMEPLLSDRLFSYRPGESWWTPISQFAAYVREHRRARPDPRTRGIHVLRRDVDSYTDTIPVGETSAVWGMIRDLLGRTGTRSIAPADETLIRKVVRADVFGLDGAPVCLLRGVPTGQPISCALFNLYLDRLDHQLDSVGGGFYARYSDDIMFAHPDPSIAREAAAAIEGTVTGLDIALKDAKSQDLYLTAAGRSTDGWPEARGARSVPFLGTQVWADGTISLSREKLRRLLRDVEDRAARTARALRGRDRDEVGRTVCSVLNEALEPRRSAFEEPSAALLRTAITNREQLAQLDYQIARIVLRTVTGRRDVRAFREIPYRRIRGEWGLRSLLHVRNRWPEPVTCAS